jgi:hypothetical protein
LIPFLCWEHQTGCRKWKDDILNLKKMEQFENSQSPFNERE